MNRRGFIGALLGFAVLPAATTYRRIWKATEAGVLVPEVDYAPPGADGTHAVLFLREGAELWFAPGPDVPPMHSGKWRSLGKLKGWSGA